MNKQITFYVMYKFQIVQVSPEQLLFIEFINWNENIYKYLTEQKEYNTWTTALLPNGLDILRVMSWNTCLMP